VSQTVNVTLILSREEVATFARQAITEVASSMEATLVEPLKEDTILLESGLDSLGFAMLVALLEEKMGYDPFVISNVATYPVTFEQFINFYVENQPE